MASVTLGASRERMNTSETLRLAVPLEVSGIFFSKADEFVNRRHSFSIL